jgi:hypothetical protein
MIALLIWKLFFLDTIFNSMTEAQKDEIRKPVEGSWLSTGKICEELNISNELSRPVSASLHKIIEGTAIIWVFHQDRMTSTAFYEIRRPLSELTVSFGTATWRVLKIRFMKIIKKGIPV